MRRAIRFFPLLLLLFSLAACAGQEKTEKEGEYLLYFPAQELRSAAGEDAIISNDVNIEGAEEMTAEELAEALVQRLVAGDERLLPAVPQGTVLQKLTISGQLAQVDFSAHYALLSGIDLTLSDYCITLTLTQLPGVNAVSITANGRQLPQRRPTLLTAADPLLGISEDALRPIEATLYFRDKQTQELRGEPRVIALYEGQTRTNALLEALLGGPEDTGTLENPFEDEFRVLSTRVEEGRCYLNLPSELVMEEENAQQAIGSLTASLCSLNFVSEVQIVVDGELTQSFCGVPIAQPFTDLED